MPDTGTQRATPRVRRAHCTVVDKPPRSVPRVITTRGTSRSTTGCRARASREASFTRATRRTWRASRSLRTRAADAKAADRAAALKTDRDRLRVMRSLQARFKAALYGRDLEKIFRRYDSGKLGDLTVRDLTRVVRGHLRMTPRAVNEEDIQFLVDELDADLSRARSRSRSSRALSSGAARMFHSWVSSGSMSPPRAPSSSLAPPGLATAVQERIGAQGMVGGRGGLREETPASPTGRPAGV